jgi:hypothetical protein
MGSQSTAQRRSESADETPLHVRYREIAAEQRRKAQEAKSDEKRAIHLEIGRDFDRMADDAEKS